MTVNPAFFGVTGFVFPVTGPDLPPPGSAAGAPPNWTNIRSLSAPWWRTWPGREPATLRSRTGPGTYTDYALADPLGRTADVAKFTKAGYAEAAPSAGGYLRTDRRVLVPSDVLPAGVVPAVGDLVYRPRDLTTWTVLRADARKFETTYALDTRNLALAYGLSLTGTLERPAAGKDSAGRPALSTYTTVGTSACRLQPEDSDAADVFSRRTLPRRYTAFLATALAARAHDRFTVSGVSYTVVGLRHPELITDLQELQLEAVA